MHCTVVFPNQGAVCFAFYMLLLGELAAAELSLFLLATVTCSPCSKLSGLWQHAALRLLQALQASQTAHTATQAACSCWQQHGQLLRIPWSTATPEHASTSFYASAHAPPGGANPRMYAKRWCDEAAAARSRASQACERQHCCDRPSPLPSVTA